jgi:hypothetical protein
MGSTTVRPNAGSSALKAIVAGGLACGVMDITAALVVYGSMGAKPLRLLQGIAAGAMGPAAMNGGLGTAALGLFFHFAVAFGAATVFYAASRFLPLLTKQAVLCGFLYGIIVYFFMQLVVVPLSAARKYPFSVKMTVIGLVIHMFCVGLPIALCVRRFSK